ncbi:hypothetical protein CAPTEDRAFT_213719, partial [Capitella teleta]
MANASDIAVAVDTHSLEQRTKRSVEYACYCGNNYNYARFGTRPNGCSYNCRVCPTGKYKGEGDPIINGKPNCENECHCEDELPCLYSNGTCTDGCAAGWRGDVCNERDCKFENGGCQHRCIEGKRDKWCSCDEGFDISPNNWRECIDIKECEGKRGEDYDEDCHTCVNTIGSYT